MTPETATVVCLFGFAALGLLDGWLTRIRQKEFKRIHARIDELKAFLVLDGDESAP